MVKFLENSFKKAYVAASSGDVGGAIGSALELASTLGELKEDFTMQHAYLDHRITTKAFKIFF